MEKRNYSTKDIEDLAIKYVVAYLKDKGEEAKVIKKGIDVISGKNFIEVKGCMKTETNLRVTEQTINYLKANNGFDNFYIYYVQNMETKPELVIFDNKTFQDNNIKEIKYILQPNTIKDKKAIQLKKLG